MILFSWQNLVAELLLEEVCGTIIMDRVRFLTLYIIAFSKRLWLGTEKTPVCPALT